MKTRGVKTYDPVLQTDQVDWLIIPVGECPDTAAEQYVVAAQFRVPHEPWGPHRAFVRPVAIRRGRRRVLFRQESGISP